jgi:hypothetical protein
MVQQVLSPGVQHAQEADLRAEVLWIGPWSGPMPRQAVSRRDGDLAQRLRGRPEQDVVRPGTTVALTAFAPT